MQKLVKSAALQGIKPVLTAFLEAEQEAKLGRVHRGNREESVVNHGKLIGSVGIVGVEMLISLSVTGITAEA